MKDSIVQLLFCCRKQICMNKDVVCQPKHADERKPGGVGRRTKSKEVYNMIYELKEVHYSLEETQTKTQTK